MDEFESLLNQYELKLQTSDRVKGLVVGKEPNGYMIDIGGKTEAFLPNREITQIEKGKKIRDFSPWINVGDIKDFVILNDEDNEDERLTLSLKRVIFSKLWEDLKQFKEENKVIKVKITRPVKGGFVAEYQGLRGFICIIRKSPLVAGINVKD